MPFGSLELPTVKGCPTVSGGRTMVWLIGSPVCVVKLRTCLNSLLWGPCSVLSPLVKYMKHSNSCIILEFLFLQRYLRVIRDFTSEIYNRLLTVYILFKLSTELSCCSWEYKTFSFLLPSMPHTDHMYDVLQVNLTTFSSSIHFHSYISRPSALCKHEVVTIITTTTIIIVYAASLKRWISLPEPVGWSWTFFQCFSTRLEA